MNFTRNFIGGALLAVAISSCTSYGQGADDPSKATLVEARAAYNAADHSRAYPLLKQVWKNEALPKSERMEAGVLSAKMEWRLYDDPRKAHRTVAKLEQLDQEIAKVYAIRSRIYGDEENYEEAIKWAQKALSASASELEELQSAIVYGNTVLAQARADLLMDGRLSNKSSVDLKVAFVKLEGWLDEKQDNFDLARLHLGHALLLRKGAEALTSWRLFYRLNDGADVHQTLIRSAEEFSDALNSFNGNRDGKNTIRTIVKGLAESGFVDYARMLKIKELGQAADSDEKINEIVKYHDYIIRLKKTTRDYYRGIVAEKVNSSDLKKQFEKHSRWLWDNLDWQGDKPNYSQTQFVKTIRERFKCLILFMTINGNYGIHTGQIILDDSRTIRQHGQHAEFRYTLIEHAYSNGFRSWLTDGSNSTGGWATSDGSFVQVRTGLNSMITELWTMLRDPFESKKIADQVKRMSENEDEMARKNKYGYLPGLQYRLILRETKEVLDSLESLGLDQRQLRYTFIGYMESIAQDAKIYAHEGRHSIDMKYGYTTGRKNLEYTAKLSEVYFAEKPMFFLGTLLNSAIGDGTSHGEANLKLVKELIGWMKKNQSDIVDFDSSRPTLPQIEKMTDDQLRAAILSFDPMAKMNQ